MNKEIVKIMFIYILLLSFVSVLSSYIDINFVSWRDCHAIFFSDSIVVNNKYHKFFILLSFFYLLLINIIYNFKFCLLTILWVIYTYCLLTNFVQKHLHYKSDICKLILNLSKDFKLLKFYLFNLILVMLFIRTPVRWSVIFIFGEVNDFLCYIFVILLSMPIIIYLSNLLKVYLENKFKHKSKSICSEDYYFFNKNVIKNVNLYNSFILIILAWISKNYLDIYLLIMFIIIMLIIIFVYINLLNSNEASSFSLLAQRSYEGNEKTMQLQSNVESEITVGAIGAAMTLAGMIDPDKFTEDTNLYSKTEINSTVNYIKDVQGNNHELSQDSVISNSKILKLVKAQEMKMKNISSPSHYDQDWLYHHKCVFYNKNHIGVWGTIDSECITILCIFNRDSNVELIQQYKQMVTSNYQKPHLDRAIANINSKYGVELKVVAGENSKNKMIAFTPYEKPSIEEYNIPNLIKIHRPAPGFTDPMVQYHTKTHFVKTLLNKPQDQNLHLRSLFDIVEQNMDKNVSKEKTESNLDAASDYFCHYLNYLLDKISEDGTVNWNPRPRDVLDPKENTTSSTTQHLLKDFQVENSLFQESYTSLFTIRKCLNPIDEESLRANNWEKAKDTKLFHTAEGQRLRYYSMDKIHSILKQKVYRDEVVKNMYCLSINKSWAELYLVSTSTGDFTSFAFLDKGDTFTFKGRNNKLHTINIPTQTFNILSNDDIYIRRFLEFVHSKELCKDFIFMQEFRKK